MSLSYQSKDELVLGKQLKMQELVIGPKDLGLVTISGSDLLVNIGEVVDSVFYCQTVTVATSAVAAQVAAVGTNTKTIKLTGITAVADGTVVLVKYLLK